MPSRFGIRQKLRALAGKLARWLSPRLRWERSNLLLASQALGPAGGAASTPAISLLDPPLTSASANARPNGVSHNNSVLTTEPTPTPAAASAAPDGARLATASTAGASSVAEPQSNEHLSLWEQALASRELLTKQRKILSENSVGKDVSQIASEIGDITASIKEERDGKEWKVPFGEDVVNMKDIVMKTLWWVHRFREIGDIIAEYDPQHAALPWAAFRFLLKVNISSLPYEETLGLTTNFKGLLGQGRRTGLHLNRTRENHLHRCSVRYLRAALPQPYANRGCE